MKSIIIQLLKDPITYTKEIGNEKHAMKKLKEIETLFGIEEEVGEVKNRERDKHRQTLINRKSEIAFE